MKVTSWSSLEDARLRELGDRFGRTASGVAIITERLNGEFHAREPVRTASAVLCRMDRLGVAKHLSPRPRWAPKQVRQVRQLAREHGTTPAGIEAIAEALNEKRERVYRLVHRLGLIGRAKRQRRPRPLGDGYTMRTDAAQVREVVERYSTPLDLPLAAKVKDGRLRRAWRRVREWWAA